MYLKHLDILKAVPKTFRISQDISRSFFVCGFFSHRSSFDLDLLNKKYPFELCRNTANFATLNV
jgi:hypothetical protein